MYYIRNWLPILLAGLYAAFVIFAYYLPLSDPEHDNLAPAIMLTIINLPWSIALSFLFVLNGLTFGECNTISFITYLGFGTLWWYLVFRWILGLGTGLTFIRKVPFVRRRSNTVTTRKKRLQFPWYLPLVTLACVPPVWLLGYLTNYFVGYYASGILYAANYTLFFLAVLLVQTALLLCCLNLRRRQAIKPSLLGLSGVLILIGVVNVAPPVWATRGYGVRDRVNRDGNQAEVQVFAERLHKYKEDSPPLKPWEQVPGGLIRYTKADYAKAGVTQDYKFLQKWGYPTTINVHQNTVDIEWGGLDGQWGLSVNTTGMRLQPAMPDYLNYVEITKAIQANSSR